MKKNLFQKRREKKLIRENAVKKILFMKTPWKKGKMTLNRLHLYIDRRDLNQTFLLQKKKL